LERSDGGQGYRTVVQRILEKINNSEKSKPEVFHSQLYEDFLLIVGDYGEDDWCADWAAFRSVPTIRMELLRGQHARQGKKT
jgi:hypothetical protein